MNWSAVTAVVSVATLIVVIFGVVWAGGKMAQRLDDNSADLDEHKIRLDGHDARLTEHGNDLARLNEWKNGYNAAAAVSGNLERRP